MSKVVGREEKKSKINPNFLICFFDSRSKYVSMTGVLGGLMCTI